MKAVAHLCLELVGDAEAVEAVETGDEAVEETGVVAGNESEDTVVVEDTAVVAGDEAVADEERHHMQVVATRCISMCMGMVRVLRKLLLVFVN